jgi:phospholipase/carboxylesterase
MNDVPQISGPTYSPAAGGSPEQLVILCHGVGADGQDLIGLAPYFAKVLPNALFVAPNAPEPYDMAPMGYQWFSLNDVTPDTRLAGAQAAAPVLNAFIDQQLTEYGLDDSKLALVGFSQGTMMSLHLALRRERPMAGVIGYSGALVGDHLLMSEIINRPPVLLIHGDTDDVVPPESLDHAVKALAMAGVTVTSEMRPGLGHGLDDRGILVGMDFLAHVFDVPLPDPKASLQDN